MDVDVLCCQEAANKEMSLTSELEEVWIGDVLNQVESHFLLGQQMEDIRMFTS